MKDYVETDAVGSGSGLYRRLKSYLFPAVLLALWAVLSGIAIAMYSDIKDHSARLVAIESQIRSDSESREWVRSEIREMKLDIKELLRETRK